MTQNIRYRAFPPPPLWHDCCVSSYEIIKRKASIFSRILIALTHSLAGYGGHDISVPF